jgi:hypothetical protein
MNDYPSTIAPQHCSHYLGPSSQIHTAIIIAIDLPDLCSNPPLTDGLRLSLRAVANGASPLSGALQHTPGHLGTPLNARAFAGTTLGRFHDSCSLSLPHETNTYHHRRRHQHRQPPSALADYRMPSCVLPKGRLEYCSLLSPNPQAAADRSVKSRRQPPVCLF